MYKAGVSIERFGKLNMNEIRYIANAYAEKQETDFKNADIEAYIQGIYMMCALRATVINFFGGKKANFEYPEKAYTLAKDEPELTEEEKDAQVELFFASLKVMEQNFNLEKEQQKTEAKKG